MTDDFYIKVVVEHGYPHYRVVNIETGEEAHCDMNELNRTIEELSQDN